MLLSAQDLVKASFDLYKKHLPVFLRYALIIYLPTFGAALGAYLLTLVMDEKQVAYYFVSGALLIAASVMSFWFSLAFIRVVANCYQDRAHKSAREEIASALDILWPVILSSILAGLAVLGGFFLLLIPSIIFSVWFVFVVYAVTLDGAKNTGALRASKALVHGRWWGVLWRLLLPAVLYLVIAGVIQIPFEVMAAAAPSAGIKLIALIVSALVSLLLTPFITATQVILYLELKKTPIQSIEPPK